MWKERRENDSPGEEIEERRAGKREGRRRRRRRRGGDPVRFSIIIGSNV